MTDTAVLAHARAAFAAAGQTLVNVRRDFPEWHRGRPHYALWALDVDLADVRDAVAAAGHHLADLLLDGYTRQPHITLGLCGFPTDPPQHPDDFGPRAFATQLDALTTLAPAPFEIAIGQLASFSSAPFLAVTDPQNAIGQLHQALAGPPRDDASGPYTPHVTVGLYAGVWPTSAVQARLDAFPGPTLRCRVDRVSLMHYVAAEIGGPLSVLADFDLARRQLAWHRRPAAWPDFT